MTSNTIINLYWKHDYLLGQIGNRDDNPVFLVCWTTTDSQWSKPVSYPITGPDRPTGLQQVGVLRISTRLAYEGSNVRPMHRLPLPPRKYSGYSSLLETALNPGRLCAQKHYVNEKFQRHQWESNPYPSSL